jgi:hypothetical protein
MTTFDAYIDRRKQERKEKTLERLQNSVYRTALTVSQKNISES